jgi:hypothetical protein
MIDQTVHLQPSFYIRIVDVKVRFDEAGWDFSSESIENVA